MEKIYTALGLMSGTSMDGVDASIISSSDGFHYDEKFNRYFKYDKGLFQKISLIRDQIFTSKDLKKLSKELNSLEKEITLFHAKVVDEIYNSAKKSNIPKLEIIGFHGQTIFHNSKEKISLQLGDGKLLSQLTKKTVAYDFRKNDLRNGGQGAPLTPIFHKSLLNKTLSAPAIFINIGGITNVTCFHSYEKFEIPMFASDIGPGNCLIDEWVRKNSNKKFDEDGKIASIGKINEIILEQAQELYLHRSNKKTLSLDVNDFDISFARGLSLEDGTATLTDFTGRIIGAALSSFLSNAKQKIQRVLICGGGRKNKVLLNSIKERTLKNIVLQLTDDYGINGDFVESQAFGFLAIRNLINEPISFPNTTGCLKATVGGTLIKFK